MTPSRSRFSLLSVAVLALTLSACGGGGGTGGEGHHDGGTTTHAQTGTVTLVNATDLFFARLRLVGPNGQGDVTNVPIDGSATYRGVEYGSFIAIAFDARGYELARWNGVLNRSTFTLTLYY